MPRAVASGAELLAGLHARRSHLNVSGRLSWRLRSDDSDNDFGFFARCTIIGSQVATRLLRLDPGQYHRPSALEARRPKVNDELKIERVHLL
jgi:hypothetical protein